MPIFIATKLPVNRSVSQGRQKSFVKNSHCYFSKCISHGPWFIRKFNVCKVPSIFLNLWQTLSIASTICWPANMCHSSILLAPDSKERDGKRWQRYNIWPKGAHDLLMENPWRMFIAPSLTEFTVQYMESSAIPVTDMRNLLDLLSQWWQESFSGPFHSSLVILIWLYFTHWLTSASDMGPSMSAVDSSCPCSPPCLSVDILAWNDTNFLYLYMTK